MQIVDFETIKNLNIPYKECFDWTADMIRDKREAVLPTKIHMPLPENCYCNVMPSIIRRDDHLWGGIKIVTRYPERVPALDSKLLLFDAENGEFLALMDADWITAIRTGAVAAHSVRQFAKEGFKNIGMIGLGNTARATLLELCSIYPDRDIHIKLLRYKDQAELFAERFSEYGNLSFETVDDTVSAVKGSDVVISCATYFANDICPDEAFDEGVLVIPIHTRGFTNCDLFFDRVYADDTGHVANFRYFSKFMYFAEVCDVVNGVADGRMDDKERILAYNIGISVHDVNFAYHIYNLINADENIRQGLQLIELKEPEEKFWV